MNEEMLYELKCEVCGRYKPIKEFSKSYPKRCKSCVAECARLSRKGKKMQTTAKVEINWEQRRYEIAKELMKSFASNPHNMCVDADNNTLAKWSVGGADALIKELKKGGQQ